MTIIKVSSSINQRLGVLSTTQRINGRSQVSMCEEREFCCILFYDLLSRSISSTVCRMR